MAELRKTGSGNQIWEFRLGKANTTSGQTVRKEFRPIKKVEDAGHMQRGRR